MNGCVGWMWDGNGMGEMGEMEELYGGMVW